MNRRLRVRLFRLTVAGILFGAVQASAQGTDAGPSSGGLFGDGAARPRARHNLDLSLSAVEANDRDVVPARAVMPSRETLLSGNSTMLQGNADYRWEGSRLQVGASEESVGRWYSRLQGARNLSHTAGVGLSARLGPRTTMLANQTLAYSPSYLYGLFPTDAVTAPGGAVPAAPDYTVSNNPSYFYGTTVGLTHGLTRRSQVALTGDLQYTDDRNQTRAQSDLTSREIKVEYSRNMARNLAVKAGYHHRTGAFGYAASAAGTGSGVSASEHGADIGVQYSRPLSATRQVVFEWAVGSTTVNTVTSGQTADAFHLSTDVSASWNITRSWKARTVLSHGLDYVAQLSQPALVTGVTAELAGNVSRRIDFESGARYSQGGSATGASALKFDTRSADLRVRYALTRTVAAYGQYFYYYYDFQGAAPLATGLPPGLKRTGMRGGLTLWLPAVRR